MRISISLIGLLLLLPGCATVAVAGAAGTAKVAAEERTMGEAVDDIGIYTEVNHYFAQADVNDMFPHVGVTVRQGRVLLTGKVNHEDTKFRAEELAWKAGGVKEVINELEVVPDSGPGGRIRDEWVEKQLEGRLAVTKGVNIINFAVEVTNGTAYFIGLVKDQAELDRVLRVASVSKGVRRVVSHLRMFSQNENHNPARF
jgi:osmotically-inducible protein OsmY